MEFAFKRLFWGFIFILIEIHIFVIDILPEPIGYYFIASGLAWLLKEYPIAKKASNLAYVLIVVSIPTVFINQNAMNNVIVSLSGWSLYIIALNIAKLIIVFYVFKIMLLIAKACTHEFLYTNTTRIFTAYMVIMLLGELARSFGMNMSGIIGFIVVVSIIMLVLEIVFLMLLRKYSKLTDHVEAKFDEIT
ncbi:hypothetical protein [Aquibacillus rhizosphaerae]|uniref:DUF2975 domain-containing protein n=1 Tax=Aquibacillus rhizosphaerae TaxID=3051431 RepID=A0ABT7L7H6_9BACI|nr:hypothetical protein [Aquibacillus sp. LR5S19]MDL4841177.1 hypothetical protein [Aquibacillus sp. LR5S19]